MIEINGSKTDRWSRISSQRFFNKLNTFCHGPQGFEMKSCVVGFILSGYDPDVPLKNKSVDSFDCLPDKGIFSRDLEHLLGAGLSAQGPETSARTTGEDNGMNVIE